MNDDDKSAFSAPTITHSPVEESFPDHPTNYDDEELMAAAFESFPASTWVEFCIAVDVLGETRARIEFMEGFQSDYSSVGDELALPTWQYFLKRADC